MSDAKSIKRVCKIIVNSIQKIDKNNFYSFYTDNFDCLSGISETSLSCVLPFNVIDVRKFSGEEYKVLKDLLAKYNELYSEIFAYYSISFDGGYVHYLNNPVFLMSSSGLSFLMY